MAKLLKKVRRIRWPATRGGYAAGDKTISQLKPPPKGPGAGVKRAPGSATS